MDKDARKRQYWAIKTALTTSEKKLIDFYELQWMLRHNVPTIEEVAKHLHLSQTTVNYYLQRQPVIKALDQRGIPWRQHTQEELTATQVAAAVTIMNFADVRPNTEKLDQLGINPSQYYAWLNDPQFKNLIDNLADQNLRNIRPAAIGEFTKKINQGDWNAVKFWLETTGELTNNDQPQSEQLLKMIVEIIQKHVKDPEIIIAIAQDIKLASANRTLEVVTTPPQITSSVVEDDVELAEARKKLGV
jgi:glutathione peroxidase-family protein